MCIKWLLESTTTPTSRYIIYHNVLIHGCDLLCEINKKRMTNESKVKDEATLGNMTSNMFWPLRRRTAGTSSFGYYLMVKKERERERKNNLVGRGCRHVCFKTRRAPRKTPRGFQPQITVLCDTKSDVKVVHPQYVYMEWWPWRKISFSVIVFGINIRNAGLLLKLHAVRCAPRRGSRWRPTSDDGQSSQKKNSAHFLTVEYHISNTYAVVRSEPWTLYYTGTGYYN